MIYLVCINLVSADTFEHKPAESIFLDVKNQLENKKADIRHSNQYSVNRRRALLIGNSNYYYASKLPNARNDVIDMKKILENLGFKVNGLHDLTSSQMRRAVDNFLKKAKKDDVTLIYYAGHAVQIAGVNYLASVEANPVNKESVISHSLDINHVMNSLYLSKNQLNLIFLDACRNDPFIQSTRSFGTNDISIKNTDPPKGTFIAYATSSGKLASDGAGRNGIFTKYLIKYLKQPFLKLHEITMRVRRDVNKETQGQQISWDYNSLEGEFIFNLN